MNQLSAPDPDRPPPAAAESVDLASTARSGALWQAFSFLSGKLVVAMTTVVLARILAPREFGLVAMATVFISFAEVVGDVGIGQALVYLERTRQTVRAAFACALGTGVLAAVAGLAVAGPVASYFGEPEVAPLVRVLALTLLVNAVASCPTALLRAELLFRRLSIAIAIRALLTGVTSVGMALLGYGPMSLIAGTLVGSVVYLVATFALLPSRPDLRIWRATGPSIRALWAFGLPAAAGSLLSKLIFDIDYVVVGSLGPDALGVYVLAYRLPELAIIQVFFVLSSVSYPLYAHASHEPERLRRGYLLALQIQSIYGLAAGTGLAVVAPLLVPLLFGERWTAAIAPMVALAAYAALRSLSAGANDVYKAIGRPGLTVKISLIRLVLLVPALLFGARWGVLGVAIAQAVMAAVFVVLMQGVALRVIGVPVRRGLATLANSALPSVAVAASAGAVMLWSPTSDAVTLLLAVTAGLLAGLWTTVMVAPAAVHRVAPSLARRLPHAARRH